MRIPDISLCCRWIVALAVLAGAQPATQKSELSGALPRVVKAQDGPYVVTSDILIPSGKSTTIEAGTVLLFRAFTGLHVEGQLLVEGTPNRPAVFTSELDRDYNPSGSLQANPYDWNGIFIHEGGIGSTLRQARILYSVYGINSGTKYIRLDNCVFLYNGRSNLTIVDVVHPVSDKPYSYALSVKDAAADGVPIRILTDPLSRKRTILRYTGLGTVAGGGSLAIWFASLLAADGRTLDQLNDTSRPRSVDHNLVQHVSADWDAARSRRVRDLALLITAAGLGAAGATGVVWSFTF